jgi:hypothetical protein
MSQIFASWYGISRMLCWRDLPVDIENFYFSACVIEMEKNNSTCTSQCQLAVFKDFEF